MEPTTRWEVNLGIVLLPFVASQRDIKQRGFFLPSVLIRKAAKSCKRGDRLERHIMAG